MLISLIFIFPLLAAPDCSISPADSGIPLYSGTQVRKQEFKVEFPGSCAPPATSEVLLEAFTTKGTISLRGKINIEEGQVWLVLDGPIVHEDVMSDWTISQDGAPIGAISLGLSQLDLQPNLMLEMVNVPDAFAQAVATVESTSIVVDSQGNGGRAATKAAFPVPAPLMSHAWVTPGISGVRLMKFHGKKFINVDSSADKVYSVDPGGFFLLGKSHTSTPVVGTFNLKKGGHRLTVEVELASGIHRVPVPLPVLSPLFQISCPRQGVRPSGIVWEIGGGEVLDIDDVTIDGNLCSLFLEPGMVMQTIYNANSISYREGESTGDVGKFSACKIGGSVRRHERGRCVATEALELKHAGSVAGREVYELDAIALSGLSRTDLDYKCTKLFPTQDGRVCVFIPKEDAKKVSGLPVLYGEQTFEIIVTEVRNAEKGKSWTSEKITLSLDAALWEHALKFPTQTNDTNVIYEVAVRSITPGVAEQAPESMVVGRLRPRGLFGIPSLRPGGITARVYLTVPVNVLGIRTPSSGLDLESSQDNPNVQLAVLETGLLFAVEPWSYIRARNLSPIPFFFATGVTFSTLDVEAGVVNPHFLAGGGLSFPVVKGRSQLDASLALGIYWNVDLRRSRPFLEGNHALFTVGTNALTIFGAQSAKD